MKSITIFFNKRKIILWEKTEELELKIGSLEIDEPFLHKCSDRMTTILNSFFERESITEISFEYPDFNKLLNDFKSQFHYIEAAGGKVLNQKDEVLVIHRFGKPDLPKGKIEPGESPEQAAVREVEEECGIRNLNISDKLEPSYHIYVQNNKRILKKTHWFLMNYTGDSLLIPQKEEGITKAEWCSSDLLSVYKKNTYDSLKPYF